MRVRPYPLIPITSRLRNRKEIITHTATAAVAKNATPDPKLYHTNPVSELASKAQMLWKPG
jgi:hypothetical protein